MYNNIGKKIKGFAKVIAIILAIIYAIIGIALIVSNKEGAYIGGLLIILIGPFIAWISSWFLYGYGELIDNTSAIRENTDYTEILLEAYIKSQNHKTTSEN